MENGGKDLHSHKVMHVVKTLLAQFNAQLLQKTPLGGIVFRKAFKSLQFVVLLYAPKNHLFMKKSVNLMFEAENWKIALFNGRF